MQLIMSRLRKKAGEGFPSEALQIAELKECFVLISSLEPGYEAQLPENRTPAAAQGSTAIYEHGV